jgi:hypothetical protein
MKVGVGMNHRIQTSPSNLECNNCAKVALFCAVRQEWPDRNCNREEVALIIQARCQKNSKKRKKIVKQGWLTAIYQKKDSFYSLVIARDICT